jgi:hypothetical protein
VHLKGGRNAEPSFTDNGLRLSAAADLSGLGNGDILILLTATANPTASCQNPGSGVHEPAGQNPAPVQVTGSQAIPEGEIKNGNVSLNVMTAAPVTPIPGAPDCPNSQWTERITDMSFTNAVLTVQQPPGTTVLTVSCIFSAATSNGSVPANTVTCSST